MQWLAVAVGGAFGALSRYVVVAYMVPVSANRFPWGTLLVNVIGCFLVGVIYVAALEKSLLSPELRLLSMTGFLGAFTTFSAFALEALQLWQYGQPLSAAIYIVLSVFFCLGAAGLALFLTSRVLA